MEVRRARTFLFPLLLFFLHSLVFPLHSLISFLSSPSPSHARNGSVLFLVSAHFCSGLALPTFLPSPHSSSHFSSRLSHVSSLAFLPHSAEEGKQTLGGNLHAPCPDGGIGGFNPLARACSTYGGIFVRLKISTNYKCYTKNSKGQR